MRAIGFQDPQLLFLKLDVDRIDEITLDQLDSEASSRWFGFRMWCVKSFHDERHMLSELSKDFGLASLEAFEQNLRRMGFEAKEKELFEALNLENRQARSQELGSKARGIGRWVSCREACE